MGNAQYPELTRWHYLENLEVSEGQIVRLARRSMKSDGWLAQWFHARAGRTAEAACLDWLHARTRAATASGIVLTKKTLWDEAKEQFPVSQRTFYERIWPNAVGPAWKQGGRRKASHRKNRRA